MRLSCGALALGVLLVPLAPVASGRSLPQADPPVGVVLESAWPARVHGGWFPVQVVLENFTGEDQSVELAFRTGWREANRLNRGALLGPGELRRLEVVLPVDLETGSNWIVEVDAGAKELGEWSIPAGTELGYHADSRSGLVVREELPGDSARVILAEALSDGISTSPGPASVHHGPVTHITVGAVRTVRRHSGGSSPSPLYSLGFAKPTELSADPRAYTSLDFVVVDAPLTSIPPDRLDALCSWMHTGGLVAVVGSGAREAVRTHPELAAWVEPRFLQRAATLADGGDVELYQAGLGELIVDSAWGVEPLADALRLGIYQGAVTERLGILPDRRGGDPLHTQALGIPELGQVPYRGLAVFLFLFAIVLGPLNLLFVRRMKKPWLLLITIPGLSLVTSIGVLTWGLLKQGFDVRVHSRVLTVLDQRSHRAHGAEGRAFFAGRAPASGLRTGAGTTLGALRMPGRDLRFRVRDGDSGRELTGDFLPVRREVGQVWTTDTSARGRVDVDWSGPTPRVTNGIGSELEALVLADGAGELFTLRAPLGAGEAAELVPLGNGDQLNDLLTGPWDAELVPQLWRVGLPPRTYAARPALALGLDDGGIEVVRTLDAHLVLGVLESDADAAGGAR